VIFGGYLVHRKLLQVGSYSFGCAGPDGFEAVLSQAGQQVVDRDIGVCRDKDRMRDLPVFLDDQRCFTELRPDTPSAA